MREARPTKYKAYELMTVSYVLKRQVEGTEITAPKLINTFTQV